MSDTMTATSTNGVYRDGTWVISGDGSARACFEYIGEGYSGDYDDADPQDAALYRLDVHVAAEFADRMDTEPVEGETRWVYPDDGSICTQVHVDGLSAVEASSMLAFAADMVAALLASGSSSSVKSAMDSLSWLPVRR